MSKLVISGLIVKPGGTMKVNNMDSVVSIPTAVMTDVAETDTEIHGINIGGQAEFRNFKSTVTMRDKDGKLEDQVFEDKLFINAWNAFKPISDLPIYELKGKCFVLIICNTFRRNKTLFRVGAEDDIEVMEELFESLNCDVLIEKNVYEDDLERILTKFKSRLVKGGYGSSIVIIMSHGGRSANSIVMEDVKEKNLYRDFVYQFSHNKFPEFIGKPKIFLVQACQDYGDVELRDIAHNSDDESQVYTDSSVSSKLEKAIKEVFAKSAKQGRTLRAMLYDVHQNVTSKCEKYNEEQSVTSFESAFKNYVFKH
ncbi:unnamed protein product [Allacma fusca]|uniref:Caspase family p20 domain-containing protein n=1 Tax=Allacma fusca TaxID=39272 RepID=A0A8J2K6P4_9HEXA|nr:unnamed protein product [Allacma fusca]